MPELPISLFVLFVLYDVAYIFKFDLSCDMNQFMSLK